MNEPIVKLVLVGLYCLGLLVGFADVPEKATVYDVRPGKVVDVGTLLSPPKIADLSGAYAYTGSEKGNPYKGVVVLTGEPPHYRAVWASEDGDVFRGTVLQDEDVLAVGWAFSLGVHPAQGTVLKQGAMLFRWDGDRWRGKWTTGERVSVEEWKRLGK